MELDEGLENELEENEDEETPEDITAGMSYKQVKIAIIIGVIITIAIFIPVLMFIAKIGKMFS